MQTIWFLLVLIAAATQPGFAHPGDSGDLICCGGAEVYVVDPKRPQVKKWSWTAAASPSIPETFRSKFRSTDDCKPYAGDLILITSSSGGVALIQRESRSCLFLAESRNAHSACLLPNETIAVASSFGGDRVEFYDRTDGRRPAMPVQSFELRGAHGTVWDAARKSLWALGSDELVKVVAASDAAKGRGWSVSERFKLPTPGGHDLSPFVSVKARTMTLSITTNSQVLLFHPEEKRFEVQAGFGDQLRIKSVDRDPVTGRIVFHKAIKGDWASDTIRFDDAPPIQLPGERLYKIRWDRPALTP